MRAVAKGVVVDCAGGVVAVKVQDSEDGRWVNYEQIDSGLKWAIGQVVYVIGQYMVFRSGEHKFSRDAVLVDGSDGGAAITALG